MLTDLRRINCEEERKFDRYIANYVTLLFFLGGGGGGEILVLHMQSYEGKLCVHHVSNQSAVHSFVYNLNSDFEM